MSDGFDPTTALRRINDLAREAKAKPNLPEAVAPLLAEIERLSAVETKDSPGASDVPQTENQSL